MMNNFFVSFLDNCDALEDDFFLFSKKKKKNHVETWVATCKDHFQGFWFRKSIFFSYYTK